MKRYIFYAENIYLKSCPLGARTPVTTCPVLQLSPVSPTCTHVHNAKGSRTSNYDIPTSVAITSHEEIAVVGNDETLNLYDYSGRGSRP